MTGFLPDAIDYRYSLGVEIVSITQSVISSGHLLEMQSKIEKISESALTQVGKKVSTLIGTDVDFTLQSASLIKKEDYVGQQKGNNIVVRLELKGTYEGKGCMIVSEKNAIRLGGKLLMLPTSELNEIINKGEYEEETRYGFDEIAKCIAGSFIETFQNAKLFLSEITCKEQQPAVDRKAAEVLRDLDPKQMFYQVTAGMKLAGIEMENLSLLLPAFIFVCGSKFDENVDQIPPALSQAPEPDQIREIQGYDGDHTLGLTFESPGSRPVDIDFLLSHYLHTLARELEILFAANVKVTERQSRSVSKSEIINSIGGGSQVAAIYSVSGSMNGEAYLIVEEEDAIRLGSLLIGDFDTLGWTLSADRYFNSDYQDSYGEICNIIAGVLNSVCETKFQKDLILEKKELVQTGIPGADSYQDDFIMDQQYGVTSFELKISDIGVGNLHFLLPLEMLDLLESGRAPEDVSADPGAASFLQLEHNSGYEGYESAENFRQLDQSEWDGNVLIINDSEKDAATIRQALDTEEIPYYQISPAEEMTKSMLADYRAIFLVVEKLDELALGIAIKVNSFCSVPLIVAASQWTQPEVMKAVRYGVNDILMTPADSAEVLQKVRGLERMIA